MLKYEDLFYYYELYKESIFLDFYKYSEHEEIKKIVEVIYLEFQFDKHVNKDIRYDTKDYIKMLVCNFFVGFMCNKCIAIPKSREFYQDKKNFKFQYIKKDTLLHVLDHLVENGYIGFKAGFQSEDGNGFVSRYWAHSKLYSEFEKFNYDMIETKVGDVVILRDDEKHEKWFRDNTAPKDLKKKIKSINKLYERYYFYTIIQNKNTRLFPRLASIFNRSSFECGGRLYSKVARSIGHQQLSKDERSKILINENETVELDYSGLHINMLYALINIQYSQDPYAFVSAELRPLVKQFLLVLINAKTERKAILAMNEYHYDLNKKPDKKQKEIELLKVMNETDLNDLLLKIKAYHAPIAQFIGSDIGIKLQNLDSKMALSICNHFAQINIPVLPVHDSFIIDKKFESKLREVMADTYKRYNDGFECKIK